MTNRVGCALVWLLVAACVIVFFLLTFPLWLPYVVKDICGAQERSRDIE